MTQGTLPEMDTNWQRIGRFMLAKRCDREYDTHCRWVITNKRTGDRLGWVGDGPWNGYVFSPEAGCIFSDDCLRAIAKFLKDNKGMRP